MLNEVTGPLDVEQARKRIQFHVTTLKLYLYVHIQIMRRGIADSGHNKGHKILNNTES